MSASLEAFVEMLLRSDLISESQLEEIRRQLVSSQGGSSDQSLAKHLVDSGYLSGFQESEVKAGNIDNLIVGDYVILHPVGRGGMGEVFRARHSVMKREVAVKFTLPDESGQVNQDAMDRFQREVEAASKLMHPNIVNSLDAGRRGETCYLVMEYINGLSLAQYVRGEGPMPWRMTIDTVTQVAQGLDFAHSSGVVHRDIKPANLLITKSGKVKILDMGLVRVNVPPGEVAKAEEVTEEHLTRSGHLLGTVDFMSPEQAIDPSTADARSDVYSLGCTLYYLLTGKAPYRTDPSASAMSRIIAHREKPIPNINDIRNDVPEEVQTILEKMLAKDPEDRFQTANELIVTLRKLIALADSGQISVNSRSSKSTSGLATPWRRFWFVAGSIVAAVFAGLSLVPTEIWSGILADPAVAKSEAEEVDDDQVAGTSQPQKPITETVDLLGQVNLETDVVSGSDWWLKDDLLYIPPSTPGKLLLPVNLPDDFRFDIEVKRVIPSGPFVIGVNAKQCQCYLIIDVDRNHRGAHMIALGTLNGRIAKSETDGIELPMEESVDLTLMVNSTGLTVTSQDKEVLHWEGDLSSLELGAGWGVGSTPGLFIGSNGGTAFEVTRMQVSPSGMRPIENQPDEFVDSAAVDSDDQTTETTKADEMPY